MRIAAICQYSPPEVAPIGVMLAELCNDLAQQGHHTTVFTAFPNHPAGRLFPGFRLSFPGSSERHGRQRAVWRSWIHISPSKSIPSRLFNYASFSILTTLACLFRRHDVYLIVSPPISNFLICMALRAAGRRCVLNIQDIYPDAAIATGILRNKFIIRLLSIFEQLGYRSASMVVVISPGFAANLIAKGVPRQKIAIIPNWIDQSEIQPMERDNCFARSLGLVGHFTVLYSGTIGLVSGAEILLEVAKDLAEDPGITILLVGDGVAKQRIEQSAAAQQLRNLLFVPFQPRATLNEVLASANVGLVTLRPGHGRNSVPSKILGYLAAARAVIASVDHDSDTARFVADAKCGMCVPPGDPHALADAIRRLRANSEQADHMGALGRRYLDTHLRRDIITSRYSRLLCQNQ